MTSSRGALHDRQVPHWLTALGAALACTVLGGQVAAVAWAHGVQPFSRGAGLVSVVDGCSAQPTGCTRYFAWAPNDYLVTFRLAVLTTAGPLTQRQALARYRLGGDRWEFPVAQLQDVVRQYEQTYGRGQHASVTLRYRINGRPEQTWTWHG